MSHPPFEAPQIAELQELIPAYEILDFIAKGGMGAVYRARQRSLDREVAIKILPREFGEDAEFRRSFETEAKAMARLNHPNLISVYDFGDVRGMPYIVMEYINGKSLFHSAWKTVVEPTQAVQIVKGICAGLVHAHTDGVIHRDIKPANILLTPNAEPKIGDFGLALAGGQNDPGLVMGTPGYAAPELYHSPHLAGEHADIFAVGVILHELLTGQPPDSPDLAACVSTGDSGLDAIWHKAVHPEPAQRYPDMSAMADALAAWKPGRAKAAPRQLVVVPAPQQRTKPTTRGLVTQRSNPSLVGKLFIIAGLLVAIAFAHQNLKKHQALREAATQREPEVKPFPPNPEPDTSGGNLGSLSDVEPPRSPETSGSSSGTGGSDEPVEVPDELHAVLGLTRDSLRKASPVFPPGTFMIAGRHFAPILRPMDRAEAEHLADLAGGRIAVPATIEEADGIQEDCQFLNAPDGFWLGGMKSDSLWRWDSGESWTFARWATRTDHGRESSAMVFVPGTGWKNADPGTKASGVLIEWSGDPSGKPAQQEDDPIAILNKDNPEALTSIRKKTRILNELLAGNAKDFGHALDFCLRKIPTEENRQRWKPQVDALNKLAENNRIPDPAKFKRPGGITLTPDMEEACSRHYLKQQKHDTDFTASITVARDNHVRCLKKSADDFHAKGQIAMSDRISAKAEAAADLHAWLASLTHDEIAVKELQIPNVAKAGEMDFSDWLETVRFWADNGIQLSIEGDRMRLTGIKGFKHRIDEDSRTVTWENAGKRASITVSPDRKSGVWTMPSGVKHQLAVIQGKNATEGPEKPKP